MQLMVEKRDGSLEVYLHTKVMGSLASALSEVGHYQEGLPEHLAEAVTTFLRRQYGCGPVHSDEIGSMIEVALFETDHPDAAAALNEHRIRRQVQRDRIEMIHLIREKGEIVEEETGRQNWEKGAIVKTLERDYDLPVHLARAIAGVVEEKVLRLGVRTIPTSLVRELMVYELWLMNKADQELIAAEQHQRETINVGEATAEEWEPEEVKAVAVGTAEGMV
jgi:hypothetical protein